MKRNYPYFFVLLVFLSIGFLNFNKVESQNIQKQYWYDNITTNIRINKDTTFDVEERQTYSYVGEYHKGSRSIPLNKIDNISDIEVIDGETGIFLIYSNKSLDKTDPNNWGKFNYYKKNNFQNIEWYYNLKDTSHTWIIRYKVHGGIGFFKDYDELYWNILTDYEVPIQTAETYVYLSSEAQDMSDLKINFYSSADNPNQYSNYSIYDKKTFHYIFNNIIPSQKITILAQWPKGIVDQGAYWWDFGKIYWGYILSIITILISVIFGFLYWFFTEKYHKGRGVIIPQYEPPKNLRPAMAEVICKEKITEKAWPATIVDLAVRGYIKIKEDKIDKIGLFTRVFISIIILGIFCSVGFSMLISFRGVGNWFPFLFFLFIFFIIFRRAINILASGNIKDLFVPKDYIIEKSKDYINDKDLEDYEKEFLLIFLGGKESFSTKELKKSSNFAKQNLYKSMERLKEHLYKEIETDTKVFEKKISEEKNRKYFIIIISVVILIIFQFPFLLDWSDQLKIWSIVTFLSILSIFAFIKYEARLNKEGNILKEDWLGFKLYLETAERYRMQNLTSDLFEKYLSYAIIFGVEKKWAKAFDSFNMQPPEWYHGYYSSVAFGGSIAGSSSFSPSSFTSSFSASFASSISSSGAGGGAGGAGGGGGGAGGGGGGGGGGAS